MREIQNFATFGEVLVSSRKNLNPPQVAEKKQSADKIKMCGILTKEKKCEYYNNFQSNVGVAAAGAVEATRGAAASQGGCSSKAGMDKSSTFSELSSLLPFNH